MNHLVLLDNKEFLNKSCKNIYLGPWKKCDFLKDNFSKYDLEIPDWHWDNLDQFYQDSLKLSDYYEKYIIKLAEVLNEHHGLNWSLKAWKILVGPWLNRYLAIIFERNETINTVYNSYDLRSCTIKNSSINDLQSKDFIEFSKNYNSVNFNIEIYSYILKKHDKDKKIIFKELNFESPKITNNHKKKNNFNFKEILKNFLIKKYNFLFSSFLKKNHYYFQSVYLKNRFELIKLNLKLKNFPHFRIVNSKVEDKKKFDKVLRSKFHEKLIKKFDIDKNNLYEELIVDLIYYMFPRCFLENFKINDEKAQQTFGHLNPKIIIDGASYHKDEIFKFWLVRKIQNNSKLILIQHGGYYENFKIKGDFSYLELDIADKYLSWGWKKNLYEITPMPCPTSFTKKKNKKDKFLINLILSPVRNYSQDMTSINKPFKSGEVYIDDVIKIANSIKKDMKLRIFLHPVAQNEITKDSKNYSGGDEIGFPLQPYLEKKIINNNVEFFFFFIDEHINYTDLNIFTYLGTPYLQTISSNIPCLVYNNETYSPFSEEYKYIYDSMLKSKLIYNNISTLIEHLNDINYELYNWWNKSDIIKSKDMFCNKFASRSYTTEKLKKAILSTSKD